jgi:hypothetical protein
MGERTAERSLPRIFERLRAVIKKFEGPLTAKTDRSVRYELWSIKDVIIQGRPKKEIFFASAIVQSDYVGFYFMPVYADSEMAAVFAPELLALRTGKSCFHIKGLDARLERAIAAALRKGFALYKKRGWL